LHQHVGRLHANPAAASATAADGTGASRV
jgi:hypothetical protein